MSQKQPVISITGSSGCGTTTVTTTFQQIFRRENVNAAIVEGDSFHRYYRAEMRAMIQQAYAKGTNQVSHFGPAVNLFAELATLFRTYGQIGGGKYRKYLHDDEEAAPFKQPPGTFTAWEDIPDRTDLLFYEGLHGGVVDGGVNIAGHADLWSGSCRSSIWNGSRSCTATRKRATIRTRPSSTPSCSECLTT